MTLLPLASRKTGWVILLLVPALALLVFTRHHSFPYTYHPDEDSKVRQILSGKRNFFHPLLMLSTTDLLWKAERRAGVAKSPDAAVLVGRWVAAIFSALAVTALTLLAARWFGWAAAAAAGLLLIFNPLIFELAHYFKEDPALLCGLAIALLALDVFWQEPEPASAAFLGLGCALAISGKYLGAVVLLFALPPLWLRCREARSWRLAGWFMGGLLLPLLLINLPMLLDLSDFRKGFARELEGATEGHRGLGRQIPHAFYFGRLAELTPAGLWFALAVAVLGIAKNFRRWTLAQWLVLAFPLFFLALLSFSPKTAGRYLLPVETLLVFWAAAGLATIRTGSLAWGGVYKGVYKLGAVLVFALAAGSTWRTFAVYDRQFSSDARSGLRLWIEQQTPPHAVIAEDGRVDLEADPAWHGREVLTAEYAADLGSLAELRARGVTHVAVARQVYNRFSNASLQPSVGEKADFERRAAFYRELFAHGRKVWESPLGEVVYLQPGLRLYAIDRR